MLGPTHASGPAQTGPINAQTGPVTIAPLGPAPVAQTGPADAQTGPQGSNQ